MSLRYNFRAIAFAAIALLGAVGASAQVTVQPEGDVVHVMIDQKPFTDFVLRGGEAMKPYLYPLRAVSGKIITRHFPMEKVEGEPTDHPHQRGLWFGHERVNGFDFWNNEANYKTPIRGRIEVTKIESAESGPDAGTIVAALAWLDPNGTKLLDERREMVFRRDPMVRIVDFDFTLTAPAKVTFGDAKDGLFGLRLAPVLQEVPAGKGEAKLAPTGTMTNSTGETREKAVWGKPADWVDYAGMLEGEKLGVAILDHPGNQPRARWHARGYGLFAANPFGLGAFTGDKAQSGAMDLDPGAKLRLRYRLIIHPGDTTSANLGAQWQRYLEEVK